MDRISNLPPSIIETILSLLPYHDVVRTSTLSKEWRYHWSNVTKIVVIEDTKTLKRNKLLCGVGQAFLMHEGPIHEVTLSVVSNDWGFTAAFDRLISHLSSKKAVKKLTVDFVSRRFGWRDHNWMSLPVSLFSMSQLTDLYLNGCNFRHKPRVSQLKRRQKGRISLAPKKKKKENESSTGFGSLTSLTNLYLENSKISLKTLLYLLSTCPLLKTVALVRTDNVYDYDGVTYTNLFESLMLIESLTIFPEIIKVLVAPPQDKYYVMIPQKVTNALVHLKYLCVEGLDFVCSYGKQVISLFIRNSPNLEKLKLNIKDDWRMNELPIFDDWADIWMEHLSELEITYLSSMKVELDIVMLILMKSPVLKKLRIFISRSYKDKELQISETLLGSLHASPVVEFIVENEPF